MPSNRKRSEECPHNCALILPSGKRKGWNFVTSLRLSILVFTAVLITARLTSAQQTVQVVPVEPDIIKLENLFVKSDTVALVKVVSGDTENYAAAVYKAEVIQSFKGAAVGETIYFGPYEGVRLGWEYVLFLRRAAKPLAPKTTAKVSYGTVNYSEVFNEGYSSMETSYECVFDGKEIAEHCDNGVRVCTDYIVLPKSLRTFPPLAEETAFGCRWVRKTAFISVLESLRDWKQP
jgi:hypothetical protein